MKSFKLSLLIAAMFGAKIHRSVKTRDTAFLYRMGAGYPGDVNRTHPASIEPVLICPTAPPTKYGQGVIIDPASQGVRPLVAGDVAVTRLYGITVRPYPQQESQTTDNGRTVIGDSTPPISGVIDVAKQAYIMTRVSGGVSPIKDGLVYVWTAASAGNHLQGGFEAAATGGSTAAIANARWNGPPDSSGVGEIIIREG